MEKEGASQTRTSGDGSDLEPAVVKDAVVIKDGESLANFITSTLKAETTKLEASLKASLKAETTKLEASWKADMTKQEASRKADMTKLLSRLGNLTNAGANSARASESNLFRATQLMLGRFGAGKVVVHVWSAVPPDSGSKKDVILSPFPGRGGDELMELDGGRVLILLPAGPSGPSLPRLVFVEAKAKQSVRFSDVSSASLRARVLACWAALAIAVGFQKGQSSSGTQGAPLADYVPAVFRALLLTMSELKELSPAKLGGTPDEVTKRAASKARAALAWAKKARFVESSDAELRTSSGKTWVGAKFEAQAVRFCEALAAGCDLPRLSAALSESLSKPAAVPWKGGLPTFCALGGPHFPLEVSEMATQTDGVLAMVTFTSFYELRLAEGTPPLVLDALVGI